MTVHRRAILAGVASVLWLLAAGASAQGPDRPRGGRDARGGGPQRMMPSEQRPARQGDGAEPGGRRLSPEERRQLRRDVHEAGRDLYPDQTRSGRQEPRRQ